MYTIPIPESKINQQTRLQLGEAIFLLAHLIQRANWESGIVLITIDEVSSATGFPMRTIAGWIDILRESGDISTQKTKMGTLVTSQ